MGASMLRNTATGYGLVSIAFHWAMVALILSLFALGLYMTGLPQTDPGTFALYQLHKSLGFTILALVAVRLLWRLSSPAPQLPSGMAMWERAGAHASHFVLYLLMFAIPLSGWLMVSASPWGIPTVLYGVLPVPHLPVPSLLGAKPAAEATMKSVHEILAWSVIVLATFHAAAAIKHHLVTRDDTLRRMISTRPARKETSRA
ncbi:cytochrome b561 [Breoghania corrubedonensis]|uniref:Cytochrome b561 n=1 Tax=Breoghania corrubedonensis TaxID=665038 RepID=A0A2T5UW91_9HYPH|nr:cytochrome b [Breoghania corrubedonensis]PTW55760.1 cytochrome b561 [Breoghania corrubedonensis]